MLKVLKQCLKEAKMKHSKSNCFYNQSQSLVQLKKSILFLVVHGKPWEALCAEQGRGITKPVTFESS